MTYSLPLLHETESTTAHGIETAKGACALAPQMQCNIDTLSNDWKTATFYNVPGGPFHTIQRTAADCYRALALRLTQGRAQ